MLVVCGGCGVVVVIAVGADVAAVAIVVGGSVAVVVAAVAAAAIAVALTVIAAAVAVDNKINPHLFTAKETNTSCCTIPSMMNLPYFCTAQPGGGSLLPPPPLPSLPQHPQTHENHFM